MALEKNKSRALIAIREVNKIATTSFKNGKMKEATFETINKDLKKSLTLVEAISTEGLSVDSNGKLIRSDGSAFDPSNELFDSMDKLFSDSSLIEDQETRDGINAALNAAETALISIRLLLKK